MVAFATPEDLATVIQRDLSAAETATATFLLDLASETIRSYTGQTITVATTTERIKVNGSRLRLRQRPVTAVTAVANTAGTALLYIWKAGPQVYLSSSLPVGNLAETYSYGAPTYVDVTYTHGFATVPLDIKAVTLQLAGRSFGAAADDSAMESENIGGYSYSMGAAAAQGVAGLLAGERAILDRYKMPAGPIRMERA